MTALEKLLASVKSDDGDAVTRRDHAAPMLARIVERMRRTIRYEWGDDSETLKDCEKIAAGEL